MPLGKLTDPEPSFMLLGRLKKGAPKTSNVPGPDLDYWRAVFKPGKDRDRIEAHFREVYGEQPRDINIRLAFDTVAENWDANLECYRNGVLVAKCAMTDERGYYWLNYRDPHTSQVLVRDGMPVGEEGAAFVQKPIDPTQPIYYTKSKNEPQFMEPLGRLRVVIPEFAFLVPPVVGWFEVQLTSPKDIRQVSAELKAIALKAAQANSPLFGIPLRLSRIEEDITKNINGSLSRSPSWMVHISLVGEWGGKALEYIERKALPEWVDAEAVDMIEQDEPEEWPEETFEAGVPEETEPPKSKAMPHPSQSRPFSPEALKDWFDERVKYHLNLKTKVNSNAGQVVAKMLNTTFGNDTDRYVFTDWLVGRASTKKLSGAEIRAMLDWMDVEKFEDVPVIESIQEAKAALEFANALHGQLEF